MLMAHFYRIDMSHLNAMPPVESQEPVQCSGLHAPGALRCARPRALRCACRPSGEAKIIDDVNHYYKDNISPAICSHEFQYL